MKTRSVLMIVIALLVCAAGAACGNGQSDEDGDAAADAGHDDAARADTLPDTDPDIPDMGEEADAEIPPPPELCAPAAELVDTSSPDRVVGTGTPGSCTESELDAALSAGGIIVFNCGDAPYTLTVTSEKTISENTVIDGGGTITLSGGGTTRILAIHSSFEMDTPVLTVQRLAFQGGMRPGSGYETENGGGAIYRLGGTLTIIDCTFSGNRCPGEGQDVAGGAVYSIGRGLTTVSGSRFFNNSGSNGGALGNLHNDLIITNTIFNGNAATGSGGNPGNGGNGGAIYIDGVGQAVEICGATISGSAANAFGGGIFRVSNDGTGTMIMDTCTVEGNKIPDESPSMAGGLYLQGMAITMTATTISSNEARGAGGMFVGPGSTAQLTNVTVAHNTALSSLGGGISFSDGVTGTVLNCTLANNRAPGEVAFAAATVGGGNVTMQNTIVDGHEAGNGWNPISCRDQLLEGGGNIQYPVERAGGGSDDPDALCTPDILVADAMLGPLQDNGGPTLTLMPDPDGPAPGLATGCPETDQRGEPRGEPCTSGAVEVE